MSKSKQVVFDDDNPEWTEEDFAAARPSSEMHSLAVAALLVREPGGPTLADEARKK